MTALTDDRRAGSDAFTQLVKKHIDFVYSAALRQVGNRRDLAEDITQAVFILLSRKLSSISESNLPGWLFKTTRYAARNAMRAENIRKTHERQAAVERKSNDDQGSPQWDELAGHIDEAVDRLKQTDRDVVLMHYFNGHTLNDTAVALGITPEAARKRASRAIERMREFFKDRGFAMTGATIGTAIGANAVQAAPEILTGKVVSAVGGTAGTSVQGILAGLPTGGWFGLKIAASIAAALLTMVVIVISMQQAAIQTPQSPATPEAPLLLEPLAVGDFKTIHMRYRWYDNEPILTWRWDQYYERDKGLAYHQHEKHGTWIRYNDGTDIWNFRADGQGLIGRQKDTQTVEQVASGTFQRYLNGWLSRNPQRDPGRDEAVNGVMCRYYRLEPLAPPEEPSSARGQSRARGRGQQGTIGEVWVDAQGRLRRQRLFDARQTTEVEVEYDIALPANAFPKIDLNNPAITEPAWALTKAFPLEGAVFKKETLGMMFAIHQFEQDEQGMFHVLSTLRLTEKTDPLVPALWSNPPGTMMFRGGINLDTAQFNGIRPMNGFASINNRECAVLYLLIKPDAQTSPVANRCEFTVTVSVLGTLEMEKYLKDNFGKTGERFEVTLDAPRKTGLTAAAFIEQAYKTVDRYSVVTGRPGSIGLSKTLAEFTEETMRNVNGIVPMP